jgi:CO/xanthine dehydrogenase FAD-binding subunit
VKPPPFKYAAVDSVDETVRLLQEHGDEAKVLAGGQSLVPLLNMRLARPEVLIDINRVHSLAGVSSNDALTIGPLTRHAMAERSDQIHAFAPVIQDALRFVGHPAIRARGTVGGSIAHADPAAELPAVLLALDSVFTATGANGDRRIPAAEFFVTYFTTALEDTELLTKIEVPATAAERASAFLEVSRRHGDFAIAAVAVSIVRTGQGTCTDARVVLAGVADVPLRAVEAERALDGAALTGSPAELREIAALASVGIDPPADVHGTSEYRRQIVTVLVRRALEQLAGEGATR